MLKISHAPDASDVYLLNPRVVTPDGEWEAWYFAHWLPGAVRYRSFWDLMNDEYHNFRGDQDDHQPTPDSRSAVGEPDCAPPTAYGSMDTCPY